MTENACCGKYAGIILVHGYLGCPEDLAPLADHLKSQYGVDAVDNVCLPGHGTGCTPEFDENGFIDALSNAIERQRAENRALILIGHSTGGNLLLATIAQQLTTDPSHFDGLRLLVLCATPPRIDAGYSKRWEAHIAGMPIDINNVAALVSLVNRLTRRRPISLPAPILIVQGENDELVPVQDAEHWRHGRLNTKQRQVRITGAEHHFLTGDGASVAIDAISRAIDDALRYCAPPGITRTLVLSGTESRTILC